MAGAEREITDPVEAAKQGIGSSKRLIAATLDDLSAHHSWLETYHRDERLRAERLRRRELRDRLERSYRDTAGRTKRAARTSYVGGRRLARVTKRHALAAIRWGSPRLRTLARHTAMTTAAAWRWSRRHVPVFTGRAWSAARDGFVWSVQASEDAGHAFRRRASAAAHEASAELWLRTTPWRRRCLTEWTRTRRHVRHARVNTQERLADAQERLAGAIATSQTLADARKSLHRWTIRSLHRGAPLARRAQATALRFEADVSAGIIRAVPEFRRLLRAHMPAAEAPVKAATKRTSRALILRPTTALACVAPAGNRLPVLHRA